jgi:hypothetical protein
MPPISCLLRGCEHVWLNNVEEFRAHCEDLHEGEQTYRLRCIHLLSESVWQVKGSLQRAALQNFSEFQVRSQTEWQMYTAQMQSKVDDNEPLERSDRWLPRQWKACAVCAEGRWSEDLFPTRIAGSQCDFKKPAQVAELLDPERYIQTWPDVPADEVRMSCVEITLGGEIRRLLMHKKRITQDMRTGKEPADMCKACRSCLTKAPPEMPTAALANGKWLGRHPEIMRTMPYGHRLLLPVRRVIMTKVIFTSNPKNPWERSHSAQGIDGLTTIVEQAPTADRIREYPPSSLADSFEAVFVGIDPEDVRKHQTFPIQKPLLMRQIEFLQKHSQANKAAAYNADMVTKLKDGETPTIISDNFIDVPKDEDADDLDEQADDNSK